MRVKWNGWLTVRPSRFHSSWMAIASADYYFPSSLPIELNTVHGGKLYEVVRNLASERWELHISEFE